MGAGGRISKLRKVEKARPKSASSAADSSDDDAPYTAYGEALQLVAQPSQAGLPRLENVWPKLEQIMADLAKHHGEWNKPNEVATVKMLERYVHTQCGLDLAKLWVAKLQRLGVVSLYATCWGSFFESPTKEDFFVLADADEATKMTVPAGKQSTKGDNPSDANADAKRRVEALLHFTLLVASAADKSQLVCEELIASGFFKKILEKFFEEKFRPWNAVRGEFDRLMLARHFECLVENMLYRYPESKWVFRECNGIDIMRQQAARMDYKDYAIWRLGAVRCLAYAIKDDEAHLLKQSDDDDIVGVIIQQMRQRVGQARGESRTVGNTIPLVQLIECLDAIAVNENYKHRMATDDAVIEALLGVLTREAFDADDFDNEDAAYAAAKTLRSISFADEGKAKMKANDRLMTELEKYANRKSTTQEDALKEAAASCLWNLSDKGPAPEISTEEVSVSPPSSAPHVFISYDWGPRKNVVRLLDAELKAAGYNTWIDVDQMRGSTLEAMADGIEKAVVVLICYSTRYKTSDNCRLEAEYVLKRRKPFVPVRTEEKYDPDGWLGIMLGTKMFYNCYSAENVPTAVAAIIKELGNRGKIAIDASAPPSEKNGSAPAKIDPTPVATVANAEPRTLEEVRKWSPAAIDEWLRSCGIETSKNAELNGITGEHVGELRTLLTKNPTEFETVLKEELHLGWKSRISFTKALETLS